MTQLDRSSSELGLSAGRTLAETSTAADSSLQALLSVQAVAVATTEIAAAVAKISQRVSDAAAAGGKALEAPHATTSSLDKLSDGTARIGDA